MFTFLCMRSCTYIYLYNYSITIYTLYCIEEKKIEMYPDGSVILYPLYIIYDIIGYYYNLQKVLYITYMYSL